MVVDEPKNKHIWLGLYEGLPMDEEERQIQELEEEIMGLLEKWIRTKIIF